MTNRQLASVFVSGIVVGLALAAIARIVLREVPPDASVRQAELDVGSPSAARVRPETYEDPPQIRLQLDARLEPSNAWTLGAPGGEAFGPEFRAARIETTAGLVAFKAWEGNGLTGFVATLCFGPEREDVRVRVASFRDVGPPFDTPWRSVNGRIQLSAWPPDRAGTIVAFELEGQIDGRALTFAGKFQVPASGTHEGSGRGGEPRIRVIANTSMDGTPSPSATRAPGSESRIERIPARREVQAFRYMEFEPFGGVQATFSFGPRPDEVQVRVDDLSDAGDPETWSALHGTIWLSPTPLDQPGSVVDFELFGAHAGGPRRFAAKFLTPP